MKTRIRIIIIQLLIVFYASIVFASGNSGFDQLSVSMIDHSSGGGHHSAITDRDAAAMKQDFHTFSRSKVEQLNRNLLYKRDKMKVTRLDDGSCKARFHEIDKMTLKANISRSASKASPYIGILSYQEKIYESLGESVSECEKGEFSLIEIAPNRHIFSYSKGRWR